MAFLDDLLMGTSGLTSLGGLVRNVFGNGEDRARQERERQLARLERLGMQDYLSGTGYDNRTLYSAAGQGADAVSALTGRLGDSLAAGGVYNSSTVAGAGLNAGREEAASLAYLSAQLSRQRAEQLAANQKQVAGLRLGYADQDAQNARQERQGAVEGFASFLGALSQYNNARNGVTQQQRGVPAMNGTQNKQDYLSAPTSYLPEQNYSGIRLTPGDYGTRRRRYPSLNPTPGVYAG